MYTVVVVISSEPFYLIHIYHGTPRVHRTASKQVLQVLLGRLTGALGPTATAGTGGILVNFYGTIYGTT